MTWVVVREDVFLEIIRYIICTIQVKLVNLLRSKKSIDGKSYSSGKSEGWGR